MGLLPDSGSNGLLSTSACKSLASHVPTRVPFPLSRELHASADRPSNRLTLSCIRHQTHQRSHLQSIWIQTRSIHNQTNRLAATVCNCRHRDIASSRLAFQIVPLLIVGLCFQSLTNRHLWQPCCLFQVCRSRGPSFS